MVIPEKGFGNTVYLRLKDVDRVIYDANDISNSVRLECTTILKKSFMFNNTATIGSVKMQYLMVINQFSL